MFVISEVVFAKDIGQGPEWHADMVVASLNHPNFKVNFDSDPNVICLFYFVSLLFSLPSVKVTNDYKTLLLAYWSCQLFLI